MTAHERVLITNDDGIDSTGLHRLALVAQRAGLAVTVAAPLVEASGSSASLAATESDGRIELQRRNLPGLPGVPAYAVAAAPAFIAMIALDGAFGPPPSLLLSGINHGYNFGQAILHSGTVGAAFTATTQGCRAMAVSVGADAARTLFPDWDTPASDGYVTVAVTDVAREKDPGTDAELVAAGYATVTPLRPFDEAHPPAAGAEWLAAANERVRR